MDSDSVRRIDQAVEQIDAIERTSKQPRLNPKSNIDGYFDILWNWVRQAEIVEPPYVQDSRFRDRWLRQFVRREPLLNSVYQSAVSIDKNRGWTLTGPKRQVTRYTDILHNVEGGWRGLMTQTAQSYHGADIGYIIEVERTYRPMAGNPLPPLTNMYYVDPGRCRLRSGGKLTYYPPSEPKQDWLSYDFFRSATATSTDETMHKLGFCAISRCLDIAKLLIAIHDHDMEKLLAKAPRGLLLLQNISETQWKTAMESNQETLTEYERNFYSAIAVLATEGPDEPKAELMMLSNIPEQFNREQVINTAMYSYALGFGYDPREFWPVSGGQLGTATETEVQHKKATGKGAVNLILDLQEQIQLNTPASIAFEFEQRDIDGEISEVALASAKTDLIAKLAGIQTSIKQARIEKTDQAVDEGITRAKKNPKTDPEADPETEDPTEDPDEEKNPASPFDDAAKQKTTPGVVMSSGTESALSREEVRILMAEADLIPTEWTVYDEDIETSDTTDNPETETLRGNIRVQRAARLFPDEPIVRYHYPTGKIEILFQRGSDVFTKRIY